jgi:putative peptidoglycan lipid II flippase
MPNEETKAPEAGPASETHAKTDRRTMVRAAGVVSFMTIVSRIMGLWRDRLMAAAFGASWVNDAFQIAFLLPNITRRLFGEGALSSAFVPVFSERLATNRKEAAFRTASVLISRLAVGLTAVCLVLVAVSIGVRSFAGISEKVQLTLQLAEVMLGYCVLINIAAGLMGILNSLGHFAAPAAAPVLLNVCMIGACLYGLDWLGTDVSSQIKVVAYAVMAGGVLQLFIVALPALAHGFRYSFSLDKSDEGYGEVMRNLAPVVFGVALFQINLLMDQLIARTFIPGDGSVTMLSYGNRLVQLPWALFSLSLATAALPLLSQHWAAQRLEAYADALSTAVRHTLFMAVPSAVGLCLLSKELVRLFYGTGEFMLNDGEAVIRTGRVVFFFSMGLVFYSLNAVLTRALYAAKDTRTPTNATVVAVVANFVLNLVFVFATPLQEAGLALASAISGALQTLLLIRALAGHLPASDRVRIRRFVGMLFGGIVVGGLAAAAIYSILTGPKYKDRMESFLAFIAAAVAASLPLWFLGRNFFVKELRPVTPDPPLNPDVHTYGVPDERWPRDLAFCHSLYTLILSSLIMGLLVWSVRESLPPEGRNAGLVFQRAIVPVAAGVMVFAMAASGFGSREYRELVQAFSWKKKANGA